MTADQPARRSPNSTIAMLDVGQGQWPCKSNRLRAPIASTAAYTELSATADTSPYAELEVSAVPWSYGQSYRGWDSLDMLAELEGAASNVPSFGPKVSQGRCEV